MIASLFMKTIKSNEPKEDCNIFNSHFVSCADSIGHSEPLTEDENIDFIKESFIDHPTIKNIHSQKLNTQCAVKKGK